MISFNCSAPTGKWEWFLLDGEKPGRIGSNYCFAKGAFMKRPLNLCFLLVGILLTACSPKIKDLSDLSNYTGQLLPLHIPPEDEVLTDYGNMFQTAADLLSIELRSMPCEHSQLQYGLVQYEEKGGSCFSLSFLPEEYPDLNPFNVDTFLVVMGRPLAAGEQTSDPNLTARIAMALIKTDTIDSKHYYGTVAFQLHDHIKAALGIPGEYYDENWIVFGVYPLAAAQAEQFLPFVQLD